MFNILVVEDDRELRELFCTVLTENGYRALSAGSGEQALDMLKHHYVDLIISDIMMPLMDGYELTRELREAKYTMPILMVTAKDRMSDKKEGFLAGTDEYMVKPVDVNEMLWRVAALLRRSQSISDRTLSIGATTLDCDSLTVISAEGETVLPQKEFFLLFKLLSFTGRIFTRRQIIDEIWGVDFDADPHTLEVHISRLRERFKNNADFSIVTVRGLGYKAVKRS
ncbi:MAG: response regulator transcription factor [Clostridia bacterium]|nr:response regulator transcription factor [Clostridia bacterium]